MTSDSRTDDPNRSSVVFSSGRAGRVWRALAEIAAGGEQPGRCLEQGGALSFYPRDRALRAGTFWTNKSRRVVAAVCRHHYFRRKLVCDGRDERSLVRRDHADRRSVFSGRMGVAGDFAAEVVSGRRS
jgi:hypothetical protein